MVNNSSYSLRWLTVKNERGGVGGETPVKGSTQIKLNICSLSKNNSVKQTHAALDVCAGTLGEVKLSRDISLARRHYSKSTLAKYIFQLLFIQAADETCTHFCSSDMLSVASAGGHRSSWG